MKNNLSHIIIAVVLIFIFLLLCNPYMFWMPEMVEMTALVIVAVLLVFWAGFIMRESGGDERDIVNRMHAGRIAYLSGIGTLVIALLVQGFSHSIDEWVLITLSVMIVSKLIVSIYADRNQ